jgi:hypothetical protein
MLTSFGGMPGTAPTAAPSGKANAVLHWIFPAVALLASAAFAVAVLLQYRRRRKPYQLAWGAALAMFALASLTLAVGSAGGWTPFGFKVYYLFGAILNVPWLGLGTVLLLAARRRALVYLGLLVAFSVLALVLVGLARVSHADLAGKVVPEGKAFLPLPVRALAVVGNSVGTLIVVAGAVSSGLALRHRRHLRPRFEGNLLIALGVLLAASGGVFAFLGRSNALGLALALGATVMFLGFRRASMPLPPPQGQEAPRPRAAPA